MGGGGALDDDEELGGVEMGRGNKQGGFTALSRHDDDAPSGGGGGGSSNSASAGSFANQKEEGSAAKFLISVLISIGIPSFGTGKYVSVLQENYLTTIEQLKQLDSSDWRRLGLPLVIEEALRKALNEHTNKEGRFGSGAAAGAVAGRAKGLDLKSASKKPLSHKKGSSIVSTAKHDDTDPFDDEALPVAGGEGSEREEAESAAATSVAKAAAADAPKRKGSGAGVAGKIGGKSKGKKGDKGGSLLLAPPATDAAQDDDAEELQDDWLEKF
jgi:hypothetical protein